MSRTARKRIAKVGTTLVALFLTILASSGTAAAHSHLKGCTVACFETSVWMPLEWLQSVVDFVVTSGILG